MKANTIKGILGVKLEYKGLGLKVCPYPSRA
jgi:hypothetical protein